MDIRPANKFNLVNAARVRERPRPSGPVYSAAPWAAPAGDMAEVGWLISGPSPASSPRPPQGARIVLACPGLCDCLFYWWIEVGRSVVMAPWWTKYAEVPSTHAKKRKVPKIFKSDGSVYITLWYKRNMRIISLKYSFALCPADKKNSHNFTTHPPHISPDPLFTTAYMKRMLSHSSSVLPCWYFRQSLIFMLASLTPSGLRSW